MGLHSRKIIWGKETFTHHYLCHYKPLTAGHDELSRSLIHFKNGRPLHVEAWTECAVNALKKIQIAKECAIVRALGSQEVLVDETVPQSLDVLGQHLAKSFGCHYLPSALSKRRASGKVAALSLAQRIHTLDGIYNFSIPALRSFKEVFVLDDNTTTGATLRSIIEAIRVVLPTCIIEIFTLATTNRVSRDNDFTKLSSASYEWVTTTGWKMVEEEAEMYSTKDHLITKIWNDGFVDD